MTLYQRRERIDRPKGTMEFVKHLAALHPTIEGMLARSGCAGMT